MPSHTNIWSMCPTKVFDSSKDRNKSNPSKKILLCNSTLRIPTRKYSCATAMQCLGRKNTLSRGGVINDQTGQKLPVQKKKNAIFDLLKANGRADGNQKKASLTSSIFKDEEVSVCLYYRIWKQSGQSHFAENLRQRETHDAAPIR